MGKGRTPGWRAHGIRIFELFRKHFRLDIAMFKNKREINKILRRDFELAQKVRQTGKAQSYMDATGRRRTMTRKRAGEVLGSKGLWDKHGTAYIRDVKKLKAEKRLVEVSSYQRNGRHVSGYFRYNHAWTEKQDKALKRFMDAGGDYKGARLMFREKHGVDLPVGKLGARYRMLGRKGHEK